jgi:hypothetical protein
VKAPWLAVVLLTVLPLQAEEPGDAARRVAKHESHTPTELAVMDPLPFLDFLQLRGPRFSSPGSKIGKVAGLMIASFRDGAHPGALSAHHHRVGTPDELRAWWVEQISNGVAAPIPSGQRSP